MLEGCNHKGRFIFKIVGFLLVLSGYACMEMDIEKQKNPGYIAIATRSISEETTMPHAVEFRLILGDEEIVIITDDGIAGDYLIRSDSLIGQKGTTFAVAAYSDSSRTFIATEGLINIAVNEENKYSLSFKLRLMNDDSVLVLKEETGIDNIVISDAKVSLGRAVLSKIEKWDSQNGGYKLYNQFSSDERLVKTTKYIYSGTRYCYFLWLNGKVVYTIQGQSAILPYYIGYQHLGRWGYSNGILTQTKDSFSTCTYVVDMNERPIALKSETIINGVVMTEESEYSYDENGNLVSSSDTEEIFFDNKINPITVLDNSLGISFIPHSLGSIFEIDFNNNNVIKRMGGTYDRSGTVHTLNYVCSYNNSRLVYRSYFWFFSYSENYSYMETP